MKTISIVFLLLMSLTMELSAQSENIRDSASFAGRKAIVFSVYGLIGNISIYGGLGGKYWISHEYCLKSILSGSWSHSSYDVAPGYHSENVSVDVYIDRRLSSDRHLIPYLGIGTGFSWSESARDHGQGVTSGNVSYDFFMLCGIEYMVLENISLSVEQMVAARYSHSHISSYEYWNVGNSTSNISLSIYF
jgi:hypothetical protein